MHMRAQVADRIAQYVELRGPPKELLHTLMARPELAHDADAKAALDELETLADLLDAMGALDAVVLDMSLARGLDYYTGVIYEAVLLGKDVGSIAAGGRCVRFPVCRAPLAVSRGALTSLRLIRQCALLHTNNNKHTQMHAHTQTHIHTQTHMRT